MQTFINALSLKIKKKEKTYIYGAREAIK